MIHDNTVQEISEYATRFVDVLQYHPSMLLESPVPVRVLMMAGRYSILRIVRLF